jgi:hypothetical protein
MNRIEWLILIAMFLFILSQLGGCVTVCYDRGPGYSRICQEKTLFGG